MRIYLICHEEKLHGVYDERPTADLENNSQTIASFILFKKDPESPTVDKNDHKGLITDDPRVILKVKQLARKIQADNLNLFLKDEAAVPLLLYSFCRIIWYYIW